MVVLGSHRRIARWLQRSSHRICVRIRPASRVLEIPELKEVLTRWLPAGRELSRFEHGDSKVSAQDGDDRVVPAPRREADPEDVGLVHAGVPAVVRLEVLGLPSAAPRQRTHRLAVPDVVEGARASFSFFGVPGSAGMALSTRGRNFIDLA